MPAIDDEFDAAVRHAAFIDHSSPGTGDRPGIIEVTGADRLDLLHRLSTNDLLSAQPGQIVGTVFTTEKGRMVDYVQVLIRDSSLLLITSPGNEATFKTWIEKYTIMEDVALKIVTSSTAMYSFIGPEAAGIVGKTFDVPLRTGSVNEMACGATTIANRHEFNTDFVDVIFSGTALSESVTQLQEQAERNGIAEIGSMAYEAFRITRGIPAGKTEISGSFNPFEVGLIHAISFTKGCYIGQEVIARLDTYQKVQHELLGLVFDSNPAGHIPGPIRNGEGLEIGTATSATAMPLHRKFVGLGVLKKDRLKEDGLVHIGDHRSPINCMISQIPIPVLLN